LNRARLASGADHADRLFVPGDFDRAGIPEADTHPFFPFERLVCAGREDTRINVFAVGNDADPGFADGVDLEANAGGFAGRERRR